MVGILFAIVVWILNFNTQQPAILFFIFNFFHAQSDTRNNGQMGSRDDIVTLSVAWTARKFKNQSELSQVTIKTLYWPIFCAAVNVFEKEAFLCTFWKILTKKSRFFGAHSPSKFSLFCHMRHLYKNFRVSQSKSGYLKIVQKRTLWVGRGSNPWGGEVTSPP